MSQAIIRLYGQGKAAGYSCVGYVKWRAVYTLLAGQLRFRV